MFLTDLKARLRPIKVHVEDWESGEDDGGNHQPVVEA